MRMIQGVDTPGGQVSDRKEKSKPAPKPGEKDYIYYLDGLITDAKLGLIAIGEGNSPLVMVQAERAVLLQRLYELLSLMAIQESEHDDARKYGKLAIEASTQQTRCLKQISSDRLLEIESTLESRTESRAKLKRIK